MFRCKSCVETKQNNIFVTGKDATKPKKDDFIKHQKSNDHKASILAKDRQNDLRKQQQMLNVLRGRQLQD